MIDVILPAGRDTSQLAIWACEQALKPLNGHLWVFQWSDLRLNVGDNTTVVCYPGYRLQELVRMFLKVTTADFTGRVDDDMIVRPDTFALMYEKLQEGYDGVAAWPWNSEPPPAKHSNLTTGGCHLAKATSDIRYWTNFPGWAANRNTSYIEHAVLNLGDPRSGGVGLIDKNPPALWDQAEREARR